VATERILIAEDEPDVRTLARYALESEGYEIITVSNGLQAVEQARTKPFTLLLTDLKMPGLGGLESFRAIRAFDPDIIGVVMTGFGTMKMAIEALKLGFDEFVIKPFSPTELVQAVNRALSQARLRRENARLKALVPLFEISRSFMEDINLTTLLEQIITTAVDDTKAQAGLLLLYDAQENVLTLGASKGPTDSTVSPDDVLLPVHDVENDPVLCSRETTLWRPADNRELAAYRTLFPRQLGAGHLLCHALWGKGKLVGLILLAKERSQVPFTTGDIELTAILAGQATAAVENAHLFAELRKAYRELAEIDHLKSEFINIVAHELRTPLALVLGYLNILDEHVTGEEGEEYLQIITQNAMRLRTIVDDMMDLRYLERKEATLSLSTVPLKEVIETAVMAFAPLAENKHQQLSTDVPDDLAQIEADRHKLELILGNLLSNAIKFSGRREQPRIEVGSAWEDAWLIYYIKDNGVGFDMKYADKLFRIFQRLHSVDEFEGTGIGLSIVHRIVTRHGGRVWAEAEANKGATFYVAMPVGEKNV